MTNKEKAKKMKKSTKYVIEVGKKDIKEDDMTIGKRGDLEVHHLIAN